MLQHVTLELRRDDWPAAKAFWSIVGFEEVEPPGTLGERSAWVERDGTQIHLQWEDDPVVPPEGHAAVVVDDWDASSPGCATRATRWTSARATGARRAASCARPGGHRVELMAAPPTLDRRDRVVLRRPRAVA